MVSRSRRFLPSLSLLTAFEAVLRTGSASAAARELDLAQSTVSRLLQDLEGQLGRTLFERHRRRLVATEEARGYGRDVTRALDLIEQGSVKLVAAPGGGTLSLAILPAFGARWLAPRLGAFLRAHPGVTVNLVTRLKRFNFAAEGVDAAIHFGVADWRDAEHMELFGERLTACAAPSLLADRQVRHPRDVPALPLFQFETRPTAWSVWFAGQGMEAPPVRGMLFDQFATMTQAAIAGLGVALLPDYLADPEIDDGRLVPLFSRSIPGSGSYWLVWPRHRSAYPPLRSLRGWLASEVGSANALISGEAVGTDASNEAIYASPRA